MTTEPSAPALSGMSARQWGVLLVLCGAIFLEGIDIGMLNVALPSIRTDLGLETGELQWVVSAYVLGYGGFMLLGGRAADLLGRRRMFVLALVVFLGFSGLGGFATESWMLLLSRFVTGVAAAFMTPAGLSIITTGFAEGPQRTKALLVYSGTGAAGFTVGLVAGGLLTSFGWRWVFFAPVVLAAVILLAALTVVPKGPRPERDGQRMDLAGSALLTTAIVLLVLGVERAPHAGTAVTAATIVGALSLLALFTVVERRIERRGGTPLIRLGILRSATLIRANVATMLFIGAFFSFQFLVVLYLQELRGWSTLTTSLVMLVTGLDVLLAPTLTPVLVARFGNARVIFGGLLSAVLAYALFLPVGAEWGYLAMLPSLLLVGFAFALAYGPLTISATENIAEQEQGLAGGLLYTSSQFGAALGLSTASAVNTAATHGTSPAALLEGYRTALWVPLTAVVLAAVVGAFGLRRRGAKAAAGESAVRESGHPGAPVPREAAVAPAALVPQSVPNSAHTPTG
ncbi:MFS transporter [Streptomyces sp. NPDC004111]|uniref:MFS transporter n=1 Tax=Streptomyces sp. NPDC004111 TaxID=3364690 RepID=UPI0036C3EDA4